MSSSNWNTMVCKMRFGGMQIHYSIAVNRVMRKLLLFRFSFHPSDYFQEKNWCGASRSLTPAKQLLTFLCNQEQIKSNSELPNAMLSRWNLLILFHCIYLHSYFLFIGFQFFIESSNIEFSLKYFKAINKSWFKVYIIWCADIERNLEGGKLRIRI